MKNSAGYDELP